MSKEIIVCTKCAGEGYLEKQELINYHKRDYMYTYYDCSVCNGSGLLLKETITKIKPYVANVKPKSGDIS